MSNNSETLLSGDVDENSLLYQRLLLENKNEVSNEPGSKLVAPKAGYCLKTWTDKREKIFVNVCTSELVLKPKDLPEHEVRKIIESDDPTKFRIPMGIGEPHKEKDKEGKDADAYDIVIHPTFFEKCEKEKFFKDFFIMLIFDGLESKYDITLCREYRILKNRKAMGTLEMQNVRSKSKPVIMEMEPSIYEMEKDSLAENRAKSFMSEVSSVKKAAKSPTFVKPVFTMMQEPEVGYPQFLVVEVDLPQQKSTKNMLLDVGADCLILYAQNGNYKLDIDLPYDVNNDETGAQFDRKTKKLIVTMKVLQKT